jgi:ankyrin repeat protein
LLIKNEADINLANCFKNTPLIIAISKRHEDIARKLIRKGADVTSENLRGETALTLAKKHRLKYVEVLITRIPPLHRAVPKGREDIVILLIDKGADINIASNDDKTPLVMAISRHQKHIAKLLIENGADLSHDFLGKTILRLAQDYYGTDFIVELIKRKTEDKKTIVMNSSHCCLS